VEISELTCSNSIAKKHGGIFYIDFNNTLTMHNITGSNLTASITGSVLFASESNIIKMNICTLRGLVESVFVLDNHNDLVINNCFI